MHAVFLLLVGVAPAVPHWARPPQVEWSHLRVGCMGEDARIGLDLEVTGAARIEVVAHPLGGGQAMTAVVTRDDPTIRWPAGEDQLRPGATYLAEVCAEDAAGRRACQPMRFTAPVAETLIPIELVDEPPDEPLPAAEPLRWRIDWRPVIGAAAVALMLLLAAAARRRISRAA